MKSKDDPIATPSKSITFRVKPGQSGSHVRHHSQDAVPMEAPSSPLARRTTRRRSKSAAVDQPAPSTGTKKRATMDRHLEELDALMQSFQQE